MTARASRRQVLAAIALADAPTPATIRFRDDTDDLFIKVDAAEHVQAWANAFETTVDSDYETTDIDEAETPIRRCMVRTTWHGQPIVLMGITPLYTPTVEPLDDTTRDQLRTVADAPAHRQVGGSGGAPGQCSAECSCGVVFDGFDTIAEAAAFLDDHIATGEPAATEAGA